MRFSEILKNKHFNRLAAIIRVPHTSASWGRRHSDLPFWTMIENMGNLQTEEIYKSNRNEFAASFLELIRQISQSDDRLSYSEADVKWFIETMDGEHGLAVASLLMAWASAPDTMYTPAEIAEATGTAASTWRNKAASGEIPALKKGKQWIFSHSVLRAYGVEI